MESNQRYYERRATEERRAAARAITQEARDRRTALAELFAQKAAACGCAATLPAQAADAALRMAGTGGLEAVAC